ncbi:MAG: hypothetical protein QNK33_01615, partial [Bacteroidales bacterium]|nr:hypothetical protein [Bacteroidales bacterium]
MQIVKYISILFGLTLSVSAIAQSGYFDLPSDSAEWFVEIKGHNGGNKGTDGRTQKIRYFVMGDTLINDTTYIPLYEESDGRILVQYYLYQDSIQKRVYFKQLHWDEGILLYDFGLNVGDFFYHTFLGEIEVIEVDTIIIDEVSRRKIVFNQT